jgi:hypothetical protein
MAKQPTLTATFADGTVITRKSYTREYSHCWRTTFTFAATIPAHLNQDLAGTTESSGSGFSTSAHLAEQAARAQVSRASAAYGHGAFEVVAVTKEGAAQ